VAAYASELDKVKTDPVNKAKVENEKQGMLELLRVAMSLKVASGLLELDKASFATLNAKASKTNQDKLQLEQLNRQVQSDEFAQLQLQAVF